MVQNSKTKHTQAAAAALAGLMVAGLGNLVVTAQASDMEKCYGIAKAGANDCQTATSACAGTSIKDGQKDAWVLVPKGMCERLAGGTRSGAK